MASILSKQELMDTNLIMLGKGAPIDIDGIGYNKVDYSKMAYLSTKSDLTDSEAYVLSSVLLKYTATQLVHIADEVKATINHYQKLVKEVKVVDFNKNSIQLSWNFNQTVSSHIKTMDRSYFKWLRPNGGVGTGHPVELLTAVDGCFYRKWFRDCYYSDYLGQS